MARKVRLFSIASVQLAIMESKPPKLAVTVHGYAVSSGWTDPELVPLEKTLSADGILDLDFVATPPDAVSLPALTPATAETVWTDDVDRLVGVRVVSRTGDVIELLPPDAAQTTTQPGAEETTQIAGEGPHPYWAAAAARATTMAVGEEGGPPVSTMATGEETVFTTLMLGEEGGGYPPTHLLGEHGGGQRPTTIPPAEEQSTFAWRRSEAVLVEPEWNKDRGAPTTAPLIEETTQIAGEGQPPHLTTELQGEEQGGGGTVFTTLIYGEESGGGGTTAPWFEEMMPGPVIPPMDTGPEQAAMTTTVVGEEGTTPMYGEEHGGYPPTTLMLGEEGGGQQPTTLIGGEESPVGTTAPLIEETTQIVGEGPHPTTQAVGEEGWYDPQNQNPLGRR